MIWKMLSKTKFEGQEGEFTAIVNSGGAFGCGYWCVMKGGVIVDEVYRHSPISSSNNSELVAKAAAERSVKTLTAPAGSGVN